jgi:hypothetical protein
MFNNAALDVVIGLVFVYLLYSLLGTLLQEIIATNIGLRGYILQKAIRRMLDDDTRNQKREEERLSKLEEILNDYVFPGNCEDPGSDQLTRFEKKKENLQKHKDRQKCEPIRHRFSSAFYTHPLIKYLAADTFFLKKKPSYIDSDTFSKVVVDLLRGQNMAVGMSDRDFIQASLTKGRINWDEDVRIDHETLLYLKSIWADAEGDVIKFKANLKQWFDEMMDRTTGWYKKYTQLILLGVGFAIAISFNVDTLRIISILQNSPTIRNQMVSQASNFTKEHPNLDAELQATQKRYDIEANFRKKDSLGNALDETKQARDLRNRLFMQAESVTSGDIKQANSILAMGWDGKFLKGATLLSLVGWLLTALAISLGAPFWFDLLNKLMQLKSSVAPKDGDDSKSGTTSAPKGSQTLKRVG